MGFFFESIFVLMILACVHIEHCVGPFIKESVTLYNDNPKLEQETPEPISKPATQLQNNNLFHVNAKDAM